MGIVLNSGTVGWVAGGIATGAALSKIADTGPVGDEVRSSSPDWALAYTALAGGVLMIGSGIAINVITKDALLGMRMGARFGAAAGAALITDRVLAGTYRADDE